MTSSTPDPFTTVRTDREYYAELWGTTPEARHRGSLRDLRKRSAYVAAVAGLVLIGQLAWTSLAGTADVRFEIGTAGGPDEQAPVEGAPADRQQRTSSMIASIGGAD